MVRKGFTIIELLVVIAIIGILASIVITSTSGSKSRGNDARRVSDIKTIQLALALYYNDLGFYPQNIYSSYDPTLNGLDYRDGLTGSPYLQKVPADPTGAVACTTAGSDSACYKYAAYGVNSSGTLVGNCGANPVWRYHLGAIMESTDSTNPTLFEGDMSFDPGGASSCSGGVGGSFDHGDASNCSGSTGVSPDNCYDVYK